MHTDSYIVHFALTFLLRGLSQFQGSRYPSLSLQYPHTPPSLFLMALPVHYQKPGSLSTQPAAPLYTAKAAPLYTARAAPLFTQGRPQVLPGGGGGYWTTCGYGGPPSLLPLPRAAYVCVYVCATSLSSSHSLVVASSGPGGCSVAPSGEDRGRGGGRERGAKWRWGRGGERLDE